MGWDEDVNGEIGELRDQIRKYQSMLQDESRDMSIVYAMCTHFITRFVERGETEQIRDAVRFAYADTGMSMENIAEFLDRSGLTDSAYCMTDYTVHMTIPVMISIRVDAVDEDEAYENALSELDSNGIDNYNMDYNTYDIDYDVEEV